MCGAWRRTAVGGRGLADLSVRNPLRSGPCWPVSLIGACVGIWACKAPGAEFSQVWQLGHGRHSPVCAGACQAGAGYPAPVQRLGGMRFGRLTGGPLQHGKPSSILGSAAIRVHNSIHFAR